MEGAQKSDCSISPSRGTVASRRGPRFRVECWPPGDCPDNLRKRFITVKRTIVESIYMSNSEWCPLDVLDVLGDPIARVALPIAGRESVAVPDVAEKLDEMTFTVEDGSRTVGVRVDQDLTDDFESVGAGPGPGKPAVRVRGPRVDQ